MAVLNTWWMPAVDGSEGERLYAFFRCDYCLPARAMPGWVDAMRRIGWRFDDLERGPHRCPVCPPGSARSPRRRLSAPTHNPALPNLIIIGAAKAGTTALHAYLDRHPEIVMAEAKEVNFFDDPECNDHVDEYSTFFDGGSPVRGEASPRYTIDPLVPGVPERIRATVPEAKLIYLVRDPIERALRDYAQHAALWDPIPIDAAFAHAGNPYDIYTAVGMYAHQLELYLRVFPAERILVVDQAELMNSRQQTLREVFRFIGVDEDFVSAGFDTLVNTAAARRPMRSAWRRLRGSRTHGLVKRLPQRPREMLLVPARRLMSRRPPRVPEADPELRERLRAVFAADVSRLRELTCREFATWGL